MGTPENSKPQVDVQQIISDATSAIPANPEIGGDAANPVQDDGTPRGTGLIPVVEGFIGQLETIYVATLSERLKAKGYAADDIDSVVSKGLSFDKDGKPTMFRAKLPEYAAEGIAEMFNIDALDWKTGIAICAVAWSGQMAVGAFGVSRLPSLVKKVEPMPEPKKDANNETVANS